MSVAAMAVDKALRCNRCGQALAFWNAETNAWQLLGAGIRRTDRGRANFVCPVCGATTRIPDEREFVAKPGDAA